jgi:hypothetical protein
VTVKEVGENALRTNESNESVRLAALRQVRLVPLDVSAAIQTRVLFR